MKYVLSIRSQNAGESAFNVLRRDTVITKTIRKDLHDGRLIELTNDMIEELKRPDVSDYQELLSGGFGKVYICKYGIDQHHNLKYLLLELCQKHVYIFRTTL
ncbi:hypothetical protein DPMN_014630 [Dreissena polymorpha]|uniref:Uncharacterized protein n=1 Tax=Dreissena polymorpha TaxID=45954 RepID=A0A9D4NA14_DREPO|nr:hypothetical protein DPMN_014630 [Dreissena polymorpha]